MPSISSIHLDSRDGKMATTKPDQDDLAIGSWDDEGNWQLFDAETDLNENQDSDEEDGSDEGDSKRWNEKLRDANSRR